jgi:hypothetical protein
METVVGEKLQKTTASSKREMCTEAVSRALTFVPLFGILMQRKYLTARINQE